jgi:hypothetical protein
MLSEELSPIGDSLPTLLQHDAIHYGHSGVFALVAIYRAPHPLYLLRQ